jgi:predicted Zn-dependent peptidase
LREEQGFCYQISCDLALFEDTGCLEISAGLDPECREQAILAINAELEQLIKVGPDEEELARAKKVAITANKLALESTGAHMAWAAEGLMFDEEIVSPQVSRERLLPVTADDVRRVAAQIFIPSNRATAEIRSL